MQTQLVFHDICDGLGVGRGATATAVDAVRDLGQLV